MNREIIKVYNSAIERIGYIEDYKSFQYSEKKADVGSFTIKLAYNKKYDDLIKIKGFIKYKNFDGIITGIQKITDEDGATEMVVVGNTLNWLLSMRINIKMTFPYLNKTLFEILNALLNDNFIAPDLEARKLSFFEIESIVDLPTVYIERYVADYHSTILDIFKSLAETYDFDFKIILDEEDKKLKFKAFCNIKATKKIGNGNEVDTDIDINMLSKDYTISIANFKNVAYVDLIQDGKRYLNGVNINSYSGFDRFETISSSEVKEEADEDFVGKWIGTAAALINKEVNVYDAELNTNLTEDLELGDKITIQDKDYNLDVTLQITEIQTTAENGIETKNYIFGNDVKIQQRG